MAICITGMHRSGTSMVARLLNLCGLWLGDDADILGPADDNPEGFWEHVGIMRLDDDLLAALGGGWDAPPPPLADDAALRPELAPFLARGGAIVGTFAGHERWGWKDPRSALVMPFWQALVPELRVIVCVRSPLAVAGSLRARATASQAFSLGLWRAYHQRLVDDVRPARCLVTHYDSYFHDPLAELRRVCEWVGLTPSDETLVAAARSIAPRMRHHEPSTVRTLDELPEPTATLYLRLCEDAGPVHAATRAEETVGPTSAPADEPHATSVLRERVARLEAALSERDERIAALETARAADAGEIARLGSAVAARDEVLGERDVDLGRTRGELVTTRRELATTTTALHERGGQLHEAVRSLTETNARLDAVTWERDTIVSSRVWRIMNALWRFRARLVPGSKRREALAPPEPHART